MRIVFIGSVGFSLSVLEHLLKIDAQLVGVCTLKESKFNADHVDLGSVSASHGIPFLHADAVSAAQVTDWIEQKKPDVIFCFGWSKLLKKEILDLAPLGVVGFHPAALPENRGRNPLVWALVLGMRKTASTFFFMDTGADSGDILSQREIEINDDDDAMSLYKKVTKVALDQVEEFIPLLKSGKHNRFSQNHDLATWWRKREVADGLIDWRMSAKSIHNLVRGLTKPYVGASFFSDGKEIKVWKTELVLDVKDNVEPGKVLKLERDKSIIKCGEGAICLVLTEPCFNPSVGSYL